MFETHAKQTKGLSFSTNMPKVINCSMIARKDVANTLTCDFRRSKVKLSSLGSCLALFSWKMVALRATKRCLHNQQLPCVSSACYKKMSRWKLIEGTQYFRSMTNDEVVSAIHLSLIIAYEAPTLIRQLQICVLHIFSWPIGT